MVAVWSMVKTRYPMNDRFRIRPVDGSRKEITISGAEMSDVPTTYITFDNDGARFEIFLDNRAVRLMIKALQEAVK